MNFKVHYFHYLLSGSYFEKKMKPLSFWIPPENWHFRHFEYFESRKNCKNFGNSKK